jgi:hypothetical protein
VRPTANAGATFQALKIFKGVQCLMVQYAPLTS